MGFAQCKGAIWVWDDFTACFRVDYLQILFPLIALSISVAFLAWTSISRILSSWSKSKARYQQLPNEDRRHSHTDLPPEQLDDSDDDDALEINGGRLALVKTTTRGSIVQSDTPTGQVISQIIEELAIAGLIAVNVIQMSTGSKGRHSRVAAITGLVIWVYVFVLSTLRLVLGAMKWRGPHLWNHTAFLYSVNWIFSIFLFRSAFIQDDISQMDKITTIVEFGLITLLFGMAMTTRKGNKTVILEWEDGIEPSREPLASLFSLAVFGWVDAIVYKGWKAPMEMEHVWNLLPKDKAAAVIADYRQMKRTGSLAVHLLKYFKRDLLIQCALAVFAGLFTFAPTLLLKVILEFVERYDTQRTDGDQPMNVIWLYVIGLPVVDLIRSYADNQALWIGRKICIRVRALIIGDIYAKALRRKASTGKDKVLGGEDKPQSTNDDETPDGFVDKIKRALSMKKDDKKASPNDAESANESILDDKKDDSSDEQANIGTIINLMSIDSFKISEVTAYLHFLCASAPTQLVIAIVLLWQVMGLSAIPGIIVMVLLLPINYGLARGFTITSKRILAATDKRTNVTNEVLQNIRIIKYFAWEQRFGRIIDVKRQLELKALRSRFMIWALAVAIWNSVPVLITFFSFLVYTQVEKKPLKPSIAFTAMSLFMLLRVPLDQFGDMFAHVQETKVSIDRVEEFLQEEETDKYIQLGLDNLDEEGVRRIGFNNATLTWGGKDTVADDDSRAFRLMDLNVDFQIGKLNIIAGPTGSGKTSMLMGLLGEMTLLEGGVYCPGGRSREDVHPDPETGLANTIAYVAQSAWLVNANVKENILFSAPFDEQRYRNVIVACALERDLEILDHGDETLVGEKGITLSGGQKQRISLARALYSNSAHLLLDDCLSAVDSHTAQWIFANCIRGPLMRNRTCVLVTHNTSLCVPSSDYVVLLENGRVDMQGPSAKVIASGKLGEEIQKSHPGSAIPSRIPSRVPSSIGDDETAVNGQGDAIDGVDSSKKTQNKPNKDAMEETKATGSVKWPVLKLYLESMGPWWFWIVAIFVFISQQVSGLATNLWVREWSNQYVDGGHVDVRPHAYSTTQFSKVSFANIAQLGSMEDTPEPLNGAIFMQGGYHGVNAMYYLTVLAAIGIAGALAALFRDLWIFLGSLTASKRIHDRLIASVTRAKFKFFDVTPLGQLMNRFSKDLEAVDQEIAPVAIGVISCGISLAMTVGLIAAITPKFLYAAVGIAILFYLIAAFYLRASRDLKRLEAVQRSPLFQQFGETLSGMTTIRAYGDERRFIRDNLEKVNTQSRPFIYLWACNRWLAFRADLVGDLVAFFAGMFLILNLGKTDAGAAGISLSYALSFTESVLWLVRLYAINEQNMNSMERIKEYLDVEQEADAIIEDSRPPADWPRKGSVEFVNYTTSYRKELNPVLQNISLKIEPQEKVGIVGRTGAGKSSLALAIFRALEADKGKILIDGLEIGSIGLQDLRENITIVPQDPTLFHGTIRTNLDPFDQYTDDQIFAALRRVQLIGPDESLTSPPTPTATQPGSPNSPTAKTNKNLFLNLQSPVAASGSNLSQGQRQLLCLARAMLKSPTVLVMDEATASIDYATDSKIQDTIRELTGTVITIAHRLATIVDYDKVLVLDKGQVVEYAHPWELINNKEGTFRSMCEMSGELDVLVKAAKKKWDSGRLVDDS
ncbi:putative YBT1-Vacuolar, `full-size` ABC protein [Fusarium austroafricanum]|uniref:Putative YBT1-Vacuolar, `full-size` ABC protein n=1 Tax=Fusarium austroafricanum TaxID=2364996 RepID=A0A8H4NZJ2_9HYPO|nr:putative YBT1-Vacuolar, `full-size` ABC protein [Fusarium austroafricanum]